MKIIDRVDLTQHPSSCKQHPLMRLKNIVEKLNTGEAVEVITDQEIIPIETMSIIARRNNLSFKIIECSRSYCKLVLVKN